MPGPAYLAVCSSSVECLYSQDQAAHCDEDTHDGMQQGSAGFVPCVGSSLRCSVVNKLPLPDVSWPRMAWVLLACYGAVAFMLGCGSCLARPQAEAAEEEASLQDKRDTDYSVFGYSGNAF